jgi:hypothetical protein
MLGTLKVNRKVKPVLTAFVSLILGALVLIIYIPFILFDILLEKLFNKG